jgi:hypothetical protein
MIQIQRICKVYRAGDVEVRALREIVSFDTLQQPVWTSELEPSLPSLGHHRRCGRLLRRQLPVRPLDLLLCAHSCWRCSAVPERVPFGTPPGKDRCPIVDTWWQTETGAIMISPLPGVTATKPGSAMRPLPGISATIVNDEGTPVGNGQGGLLPGAGPAVALDAARRLG